MIHGSKTRKEDRDLWQTPDFIFNWAQERCGPFDVDLAANAKNTKCREYYGQRLPGFVTVDALSRSWSEDFPGGRGWLNPPYSNISPWIAQAVEEARRGFSTAMLIPSPNGEKYTAGLFKYATEIAWIIGRIPFVMPSGAVKRGNPRGSVFVYFEAHKLCCKNYSVIWLGDMQK